MSSFLALLKRDITLSMKEGGTLGIALGFNLIVVTLLPLGIGPDLNLLNQIAPGVLWVTFVALPFVITRPVVSHRLRRRHSRAHDPRSSCH